MKGEALGIGILGCGRIAAAHAKAIAMSPDEARLVAVADVDQNRAEAIADSMPDSRVMGSLEALLACQEVEAVIVCTPNESHAENTIAALTAGKHVLVEKPMAENANDAARMCSTAVETQRTLVVAQTLRHTDPVRFVQDHRHEFGRLRAVEVSMCVHWDGPQASWWQTLDRDSGLILSLFAPHALDFVQLVIGEEPVVVRCEAAQHQSGWQGEDEAMILLRYPGGCLASVHVSYNQSFVIDRKTLHFEKALIRIENGDQLWADDELVIGEKIERSGAHQMGRKDLSPMFATQLLEFVAATRGLPHRSVLHTEGLRLMSVLDRVRAAANEREK